MTFEQKPDQYIDEFDSGGPKIYAYVTVGHVVGCRKTVCKVREIKLKYAVSQLVNFDLIKEMVVDADNTATVIVHTDKKIKRKRHCGLYI
jgi:hypothetical protein